MNIARIIIIGLVLLATGCTTIGPQSVERDRFDYNSAISNSWKEQTLLNIVKIRYADMPLFVEVASVVSGYTLETAVNIGGTISTGSGIGDFVDLGTAGKYTDRPTITYAPITGQQFNKSFMTPIPPGAVLFLTQSGWPVDLILPLTVDSINGLRSRISAGANSRTGDPKYYRVIELLRKLQRSGAVGMQVLKGQNAQQTTVLFFHRKNLEPEAAAAIEEVDRLLGLNPDRQQVTVRYGLLPQNDTEIAMLTRSMLQIMIELAIQVDVPPEHVAEGRTVASPISTEKVSDPARLVAIHHSEEEPEDAFAAVKYRDHWYWIDDRDFKSKRTFTFLMILISLTESGGRQDLPLVTIPAG